MDLVFYDNYDHKFHCSHGFLPVVDIDSGKHRWVCFMEDLKVIHLLGPRPTKATHVATRVAMCIMPGG